MLNYVFNSGAIILSTSIIVAGQRRVRVTIESVGLITSQLFQITNLGQSIRPMVVQVWQQAFCVCMCKIVMSSLL